MAIDHGIAFDGERLADITHAGISRSQFFQLLFRQLATSDSWRGRFFLAIYIVDGRDDAGNDDDQKEKKKVDIPMLNLLSIDGRMVFINVLVLAAYVGLLDVIGFVLATFAYLIAAPLSMKYSKPVLLAIFASVTTAVMAIVFGIVFYVPLPRGVGLFRELSYLIY